MYPPTVVAPRYGRPSWEPGRRPAHVSTTANDASAGATASAASSRSCIPAAVTRASKPASSTVAPTSRRPSSRGTRYRWPSHTSERIAARGVAIASIWPAMGRTRTRAASGTPGSSPAHAPAARVAFERETVDALDPHAERFAARQQCAPETAVVDLRFVRDEQPAGEVACEHRLARQHAGAIEDRDLAAVGAKRLGVRGELGEPPAVERDVQRPVAPKARVDAGPFAQLRDDLRIDRERVAAERAHPLVRHLLAERRQHPGAGPRSGPRRLGPVVHRDRRPAPAELVRDAEPDQPRPNNDDVRRGYIPV